MKKAVPFFTLVMLSGCVSYQPQPIVPVELLQSFEARTLGNPDLLRYIAAHLPDDVRTRSPGMWDFTTLTLAAFYYSPELDIARAKNSTSQAAVQTAGQHPNPSLQLPFGYTSNAKAGESPYTFGLGLDIPIETAGKRGYRIERARQLSDAARFNIGNVAWQIRSRLRSQMLILHAAIDKASILEQQLATQQQIVDMLDKRLSMGAISAPEAYQARIALTQRRLDLDTVQKLILDTRAQMASTIGLPVNALTNADIRFDAFEPVYPDIPNDTIRRQAVLNRADVLGALADYEASQAALQLEIAGQYPDLHLGPGYTFDAGANKFALSVSGIALPIFHQNQGQIAEATAHRTEAAAHFNALQTQALNEADRAVQNYRVALKSLRLSESQITAQQRQLHMLERVFQTGQTDRLALALARLEFTTSTLARQEALIQVQQNIGQLEDTMQRPLSITDLQFIPDGRESK